MENGLFTGAPGLLVRVHPQSMGRLPPLEDPVPGKIRFQSRRAGSINDWSG